MKYGNIITEYNGQRFHSRKEARYAALLDIRKKAGDLQYYLRQVPFHLPGNTVYKCDFMVVEPDRDGVHERIRYIDVKGFRTQAFIRSKKHVESVYGVTIEEA